MNNCLECGGELPKQWQGQVCPGCALGDDDEDDIQGRRELV